MSVRKADALEYHARPTPGKLSISPTKPCQTQRDLSLAYTPGVAEPCREIARDPSLGWLYTSRSNLVAVVTNGTAVLGLGNIGPLAGKPVMEGKAVLFKRFADIDVFDLEVNSTNPDDVIKVVQLLELTFGGINLEDIRAPECFYIEQTLRQTVRIPVFHDDQHGTAIISGAALINAAQLAGKRLDQLRDRAFRLQEFDRSVERLCGTIGLTRHPVDAAERRECRPGPTDLPDRSPPRLSLEKRSPGPGRVPGDQGRPPQPHQQVEAAGLVPLAP